MILFRANYHAERLRHNNEECFSEVKQMLFFILVSFTARLFKIDVDVFISDTLINCSPYTNGFYLLHNYMLIVPNLCCLFV